MSSIASALFQDDSQPIHFDTTTISPQDFTCEDICTSRVFQAPSVFRYAVVEVPHGTHLDVRLFDESRWIDWTPITPEEDRPDGSFAERGAYTFVVHAGRAFQLRSAQALEQTRVITYSLPPPAKKLLPQRVRMAVNSILPQLPFMQRSDWLDPSIELQEVRRDQLWKSNYTTVKKIVIHHTATAVRDVTGDGVVTDADYREAVRGIYSYHTYSQKWGDVGYNYIIDPAGKIWEGRFGGDGVVAGHVHRSKACTRFTTNNLSLNEGSMGIAMLGTFSSDTPSFQARDSLVQLIAQKSWEFDIDPSGSGFFIDAVYPNILAHRDLDCTDCPGSAFYADMPSVVRDAAEAYSTLVRDIPRKYAAEKITLNPAVVEMKKDDDREVTAMFWNTGTTTWRGYGEAPLVITSSAIKEKIASLEALHLASREERASQSPVETALAQGKLTAANVEPRRAGTFVMKLADPPDELISQQTFTLALGQKGWIPSSDASVQVVNTGLELAALRTEGDGAPEITDEPGRKITIHFTNKGTTPWKRGEVLLALQNSEGITSDLKDRSWKKPNGQFAFDEKEVAPGEQATFSFLVSVPYLGIFQETTILLVKEKKVSGSDYTPLVVTVKPAYDAEVVKLEYAPTAQVRWKPQTTLVIKNTGIREWKNAVLTTQAIDGKGVSPFRSTKWKNARVIQSLKTVKPGETTTLTFNLAIPAKPGLYRHTLSFVNGKQKVYVKSGEEYVGGIDQEVRVDPVPGKKKKGKK
ncbi:MAG: peptidoglycan recognition family protein [Patescibacteria group bacterium]